MSPLSLYTLTYSYRDYRDIIYIYAREDIETFGLVFISMAIWTSETKLLSLSIVPNKDMIGIPIEPSLKAELVAEAWLVRMTLAAYLRSIIEKSKTPDGRQRVWTKMRKRGRPKR